MKRVKHIIRKRSKARRGNALIMAILTTMLLFIVGMVFLSSTITEKDSVANLGQEDTLDNGVKMVIDRIHTVLAEDMDSGGLLNQEPYDYPGDTDRWLASLEPEMYYNIAGVHIGYYWPHITDLWENFSLQSVEFGDGSPYKPLGSGPTFPSYEGPLAAYYYDPDDLDIGDIDPWNSSGQWQANSAYDGQNLDSHPYWVSAYNTVAKIIPENEPIKDCVLDLNVSSDNKFPYYRRTNWIDTFGYKEPKVWFGSRADADGDGVADSRWAVIPDSKIADQDQWLWAAVRIVDNGGMINLNTAFRDPSNLTTNPGNWDGSILTHINLDGIGKGSDSLEDFQNERQPGIPYDIGDYQTDTQYDEEVAQRVRNPKWADYTPFDLTDELELRNRGFLNSSARTRTEDVWTKTFLPYWPNTIKNPYLFPSDLDNWFEKAAADGLSEYYTRRHICTAYNFDRTISPRFTGKQLSDYRKLMGFKVNELWNVWNQWQMTYGRPVGVNDVDPTPANPNSDATVKQLAAAIWQGLDDYVGTDPNFTPILHSSSSPDGDPEWTEEQMRTRLACLMAVNLMDYIDSDDPNRINTLNGIGVYKTDASKISTETYYGFESQRECMYIDRLGIAHYNDSSSIHEYFAISLYNPDNRPISSTADWKLICYSGNSITEFPLPAINNIPKDHSIVLINQSSGNGYSVGDILSNNFNIKHCDRIVLLDDSGVPLDAVNDPNNITLSGYLQSTPLNQTRYITTGSRVEAGKIIGYGQHKTLALNPRRAPWMATDHIMDPVTLNSTSQQITAPIQLRCNDSGTMKNIGEVFNVLAIGSIKSVPAGGGPVRYTTMSECWYRYIMEDKDGDGSSDNDIAARFNNLGRINAADSVQAGKLMQFLTVFNPFSDSADNDGNGLSDDPEADGEDNNHDGTIDDPAETFANNYGEKHELNVAGRININTAPWYVIAKLPWIQDPTLPENTQEELYQKMGLAHAIAAYRDKKSIVVPEETNPQLPAFMLDYTDRSLGISSGTPAKTVREEPGFMSINELLNVTHDLDGSMSANSYNKYFDIRRFGRDTVNNDSTDDDNGTGQADYLDGPFYDTQPDDATDDIEERDILFKRISNLVTVRSDVFTAYILVRIGRDGPQKRVIAIFDRSNVFGPNDKPKLVALHPVPDYK